MRPNRLRRVLLTAATVAIAVIAAAQQGPQWVVELLLDAGPFLLVAALLVRGRFIGERRLVARYRRARPRLVRAARRLWPPRVALAPSKRLDPSARPLRGPPVLRSVSR